MRDEEEVREELKSVAERLTHKELHPKVEAELVGARQAFAWLLRHDALPPHQAAGLSPSED